MYGNCMYNSTRQKKKLKVPCEFLQWSPTVDSHRAVYWYKLLCPINCRKWNISHTMLVHDIITLTHHTLSTCTASCQWYPELSSRRGPIQQGYAIVLEPFTLWTLLSSFPTMCTDVLKVRIQAVTNSRPNQTIHF